MSQPDDKDRSLASDGRFAQPLARVAYEPGMLLGLEATRAEQDYHRRRLTRHDYWLHGAGTLCGLAVSAEGRDPGDAASQVRLRLLVAPGIAIDGLGRELTVQEPHCIDLTAWLGSQHADPDAWGALVRDGYEPDDDSLWLKVTARYQDIASGLQPVMANEPNAGTDPVEPSRVKDCVLFELLPERPGDAPKGQRPFAAHPPLPTAADVQGRLTKPERDAIAAASGEARRQLDLASRLLYLLPGDNLALELADQRAAALAGQARILLARVSLRLGPDQTLIVNPRRLAIDNLARPFVVTAGQLAWLGRNP